MQERLSFRDRLAALSRRELVALAAVAAVVVAGAGLWYARSLPSPVEVRAARGSVPVAAPAASSTESESPTVLFVQVGGLVRLTGTQIATPPVSSGVE